MTIDVHCQTQSNPCTVWNAFHLNIFAFRSCHERAVTLLNHGNNVAVRWTAVRVNRRREEKCSACVRELEWKVKMWNKRKSKILLPCIRPLTPSPPPKMTVNAFIHVCHFTWPLNIEISYSSSSTAATIGMHIKNDFEHDSCGLWIFDRKRSIEIGNPFAFRPFAGIHVHCSYGSSAHPLVYYFFRFSFQNASSMMIHPTSIMYSVMQPHVLYWLRSGR